mmetsp:Transcript_11835/g.17602  ORF Transcript_11835/g.17602 Transcript_11835/m.17602 type:complete len:163 (+) Transcript_11835:56-544(+)
MATAAVLSLAFLAGIAVVPVTFRCMNMPLDENPIIATNTRDGEQVMETSKDENIKKDDGTISSHEYTEVPSMKESISDRLKKKKKKTMEQIQKELEEKQRKVDEEKKKEGIIEELSTENDQFEKIVAESHPYGEVKEENLYQAPQCLDMEEHADLILDDEDQ